MNMELLPAPTEAEERQLRAEIGRWLENTGADSTEVRLHIPAEGEESVCMRARGVEKDLTAKPTEVYPVGFRPVCRQCWTAYMEAQDAE